MGARGLRTRHPHRHRHCQRLQFHADDQQCLRAGDRTDPVQRHRRHHAEHAMKGTQSGAVVIEFALVLVMFLMFLFGIIETSRMLYAWNAATQAARVGARYAVVCADGTATYKAEVLQRMKQWAPQISTIAIDWSPASCTASTCESVTVSVT